MEILFVFDTPGAAIGAEQALLDAGLAVKVMSVPSSIRAGCGLCLRLSPEQRQAAETALAAAEFEGYHLYTRHARDGQSVYAPYKENEHD